MNAMQNTAIVCMLLACKAEEGSIHTPGWEEPYSNIFLLKDTTAWSPTVYV